MRSAIIFLIYIVSLNYSYSQDDATVAPSKGKKIGKVINDAISTALPGVSSILNLFSSSFDNKDKIEMKKDEFEVKLTEVRKEVNNEMIKNFQTRMKGVVEIQKEIEAIRGFLVPVEKIRTNNQVLIERLSGGTIDWIRFQVLFDIIKNYHNFIKGINTSHLRSTYAKVEFDEVAKILSADVIPTIDTYLKKPNNYKKEILEELKIIDKSTKKISLIIAFTMEEFNKEFKELSNWANGAASGSSASVNLTQIEIQNEIKLLDIQLK